MKTNYVNSLFTVLMVVISVLVSCTKEVQSPEDESVTLGGDMMLKSASVLPDCSSLSITPGAEIYYKRTESNIVSWGSKNGPSNSKIVEIEYYNTETEFILKVKSTSGWLDLLINGISKWNGGAVAANEWGIYKVPLAEGWKACDLISYDLKVTGNGPQASFTVRYYLIGICSHCREQFNYEKNFDGTYTFSYTPSQDYTNANVVFTFTQADHVIISGLPGWITEGQIRKKSMNLVRCKTYEWIVGVSPKYNSHAEDADLWTDFKVNSISKKNISEPTPNIDSDNQ